MIELARRELFETPGAMAAIAVTSLRGPASALPPHPAQAATCSTMATPARRKGV
jgi:hypothetical protein